MMHQVHHLPEIPPLGKPESFYAHQAHTSEKSHDIHLHEATKVAQYVTLAINPLVTWKEKKKYFTHALHRHCNPPALPDDEIWLFYQKLSNLVKLHAGEQALRLASAEDDEYARRASKGEPRSHIVAEAQHFFYELMTLDDHKPDIFSDEDWVQLKLIRDQWMSV